MSGRRGVVASLVALALLGAACGGNKSDDKAAVTTVKRTTTTVDLRVPAPLTGVLVDPDKAARPVVAVKVDNSPSGRPQAGIEHADVLFEEMVEGGVTRFVALFHSADVDLVGPIRSMRPSDSAIVAAFGGVFAFSDGVPQVVNRLRGIPVVGVYEMQGAGPFTYPSGRQRPYKTFASTDRLRKEAAKNAAAPPALVGFLATGEAFVAPDAGAVAKASVVFGGKTVVEVTWDAEKAAWLRSTNGSPHTVSSGDRLSFTSVIVQYVRYVSAGYNDSAGSRVEEAQTVGAGEGLALVDGKQVKIRWSKPSLTAPTVYTDLAGAALRLPPGRTLILLPPVGSATTVSAPVPSTTTQP